MPDNAIVGVVRRVAGPLPTADELPAWLAFAGCLISVFMQMIDVTIVNTALPDITRDLGATQTAQLLVVAGYSLAFACTLLTAARIGALVGRRTMFLVSVVGFTAASLWCGMSTGATELVIARVAQGVTGAGMAAQTIAILTASFPRERHQLVFALYGATAGFAGMLGPIVGGVLITLNIGGSGWHAVFLMNLPLGLLAFVLAYRFLHLGPSTERERLDLTGVVLSTVSLFLLLSAMAEVQQNGWRAEYLVMVAVALAIAAVFVAHQLRRRDRGGTPLVRLELFADRRFAVGSILVTIFFGLFTAFVFAASIILQDVLHWSPLRTGIAMTPFALGAAAGALSSPLFIKRWGVRTLAVGIALFGGCVAIAAGYLWVTDGDVSLALAVGPVFVAGYGIGAFGVPLQPVMLAGLDEVRMAEASGTLPTIEQVGNAVGLAVLSTVFFRAHTLTGSITMLAAIAAVAVVLAVITLALPEPAAATPD
ncbi:EmrB/QacA subfamily drug resistance transporter [Nocardia transvalensis]|uniref:EmrB/QacA subfamily drug resistance transporter n=1 Tax=Nocardia transvalensis TaxID=37333 RepID=A0A7W9PKI2_9NOCA|nr:MFS transporter [Nocardia transvalensis]MBB5917560.1 EmrB/QacA subfamily drug resistance transporter [Nocardia transvalensis]